MEELQDGKFYHIYNRGINRQDIFIHNRDYLHFIELYNIFIGPVAKSYAYCLMKNHFHFLVYIKQPDDIGYLNPRYAKSKDLYKKWKVTFPSEKNELPDIQFKNKPIPDKMFQHLFSAYAKWFNTKHQRTGSLLEHPYNRILVDNEKYLRRILVYIHMNPVKHGFCRHPVEYPWTSYLPFLSDKESRLQRREAFAWFDSRSHFELDHNKDQNFDDIQDYLFEFYNA